MRIVDLTFPVKPHFRWKVATEHRSAHAKGDLFQATVLTIHCHAFTHVDAPLHFLPDGRHIAEMPVDQWVGEAAVVDLTHIRENGEVTGADLEAAARHVRPGDIALLRTDWPRRVSVEREAFWRDAPYTGKSACDWLIRRQVKAVGYDYPPDYCIRTMTFEPEKRLRREDNTTHQAFFPAGIAVIEYLTNLDQIGASRCRFVALPLPVQGADGSPVRAVAFVE
ncbi:MAG TPA: cyclase family protein [Candidatus Sulfotelmatobacter sp.]|nr:cyclase family protein [Candidatus Sulfotelmatobacter sp.]